MAPPNDYYHLMGVAKSATPDEIKRAHRKLARKYHPDVSKEPEKRAAYDQYGEHWKEAGQAQARRQQGTSASSFEGVPPGTGEDPNDVFEQLFRHGFSQQAGDRHHRSQPFAQQGQDRHARIDVTLEEAYAGATRRVILSGPSLDAFGQMHTEDQTLEFKIPAGIRAGQHIRLAGKGWPGTGGAPAGDLFLDVAFLPHPLYRIDKTDVFLDLPVSPCEAALGAQLEVPTPTGIVSLRVPSGSTQGKKLRLRGKGLPAKEPGDFYFVLSLVTPLAQSEADRAAYQQWAEHFKTFNPRKHLGAAA